jgi:hypothetical protein
MAFPEPFSHLFEILSSKSSLASFLEFDDDFSEVKFWISFDNLIELIFRTIVKGSQFGLSHFISFGLELFLTDIVLQSVDFKKFFWFKRRVLLNKLPKIFLLSKDSS